MKPTIDFNRVEPHQLAIHERLVNWANWVSVRPHSRVQPMFRYYRPAQHWEAKEFRTPCDLIDAQALEKVVGQLPPDHAFALRWAYVYRFEAWRACKCLAVHETGLHRYLRDARQMVLNLVD
jgi:hypothetical protein